MEAGDKTKEEFLQELEILKQANAALKAMYDKEISNLKNTEKELIQSEAKFRSTFDHSPVGSVIVGLDTCFIRCNSTFCNFLGYTENELIGESISSVTYQEDKEIGMNELKKMVAGQLECATLQKRYLRKDGNIVWGEIKICLVRDQDNKPLYFLPIIQDITERKRVEEALRDSENDLKRALQLARLGNWELDHVTYRLHWSDTIFELFEIDPDKFEATYDAFLGAVHPDDRERVNNVFTDSLINKTPYNISHRLQMKDGRIKWVNEICRTEYDLQGKPIRSFGIVQDITESKQAELIIQEQNNQLQKLNASKDKFFSIIAHDLKSPFQSLMGFTELMVENIKDFSAAELSAISKKMHGTVSNLFKLLKNLLEWSQMQQGTIIFSPQDFSLAEIVKSEVDSIYQRAVHKEVTIINTVPDSINIFADGKMVNSILGNLLSNAVKFTKPGGQVIISARLSEGNIAEISVADTGIGMSADLCSKLFKMEEQAGRKGTEGEDSTGLGLLLCKEFVEKHECKIWVESEEWKGTIFYFTLPLSKNFEKAALEK